MTVVSGRSLLKIAKIKGSTGIKGDINLVPLFFSSSELKGLLSVCQQNVYAMSAENFPKKINITKIDQKHIGIIIKVAGIDTKTDSDALKGLYICVDTAVYNTYLVSTGNILRLIGYTVVDKRLGELGTVHSVSRGKQDILSLDEKEEKLIPFVKDLIESIDDDNKLIKTKLPEGIFEQ